MLELLRAIRVGAISLFGVAIPGFLLLFITIVGFLVPSGIIILLLFGGHVTRIGVLYVQNKEILLAIFVVLSYVAGYILRLTSPDELDEVSGKRVLCEMQSDSEKKVWPYTGKLEREQESDKFPYSNLYGYLEARGLKHLLHLVPWKHGKPDSGKRSKTAVHKMKLSIKLHSAELAAEMESNEAHIRLMSGTWIAIKKTQFIVFFAATACLAAAFVGKTSGSVGSVATGFTHGNAPYLYAYGFWLIFVSCAMWHAKDTIERLFHYRRVNEIVWIVMAAYEVEEMLKHKEKLTP